MGLADRNQTASGTQESRKPAEGLSCLQIFLRNRHPEVHILRCLCDQALGRHPYFCRQELGLARQRLTGLRQSSDLIRPPFRRLLSLESVSFSLSFFVSNSSLAF